MSRWCCNCFSLFRSTDSSSESQPLIAHNPIPNAFTYGSITTNVNPIAPNYYNISNDNFYAFMRHDIKDVKFDWKIHISIQNDFLQVRKACNVILPIIRDYNIGEFKVEKPANLVRNTGKTITLYLAYNPDLKVSTHRLAELMTSIESSLIESNINPGPAPEIDERISGSQYLYYRNERGQVVDEEDELYDYAEPSQVAEIAETNNSQPYNPYNHVDSFGLTHLEIILPQQQYTP